MSEALPVCVSEGPDPLDWDVIEETSEAQWQTWRLLAPVWCVKSGRMTRGEAILALCRSQGFDPWVADRWITTFANQKVYTPHWFVRQMPVGVDEFLRQRVDTPIRVTALVSACGLPR